MRLIPNDLKYNLPPMKKAQILAEVNNALEIVDRLNTQIKIWSIKDISDIYTKVMQDELKFLKEGRV